MATELRTNVKAEREEQPATVADVNQPLLIRGTSNTQTIDNENNLPSSSHGPAIHWAEGTVDNEFMGKKKSSCCCIYEKPRKWNESSSSSDSSDPSSDDNDDTNKQNINKHTHCTEHCRGHTKRCFRKKKNNKDSNSENFEKPTPSSSDFNPNGLCS
ncbi:unnamed protein product [Schistosoma rodhaini]|uniref:Protein phosphatase inhibitor protein n=1 Tax=Schistosoma rodhaini TaxID=6188 RepID=A0A183R693_9TREM|nr:unnamed protein product [Schistosoma rodhaini]CAH8646998.1 unnamed protein product [Schistosoma rodhaini]